MKHCCRKIILFVLLICMGMYLPVTVLAEESGVESNTESNVESGVESNTESNVESGTESDTESNTETGAESGTESKAESSEVNTMVESLLISTSKKGFHPSNNNYLRIKGYVDTKYQYVDVRLRIYNKKGQYILQKKLKNVGSGFLDFSWNGKPTKKNQANLSNKKYVKSGTYTVEIYVKPKNPDIEASVKTCKFKVSSKAASGENGLAEVKTYPILTGDREVDYMAEKICKSAGINTSQSDSEKVRRIYHWMTVNQKHNHYYEGGSFKTYYKLSSSVKKINKYRKSTDALLDKGKLIYNHDSSLAMVSWCMERRIGVCNDHADIFKILCNHVGIEAGICSGYYLNRNGTKAGHSWNYAIIEGKTYYYDVDVEIQNYGKGQGDYYWFQKNRTEAEKTHEFYSEI